MKRFPLAAALSVAFAGVSLATSAPAQPVDSAHDAVEMEQLLAQEQRVDNFYRAYFPDLDIIAPYTHP